MESRVDIFIEIRDLISSVEFHQKQEQSTEHSIDTTNKTKNIIQRIINQYLEIDLKIKNQEH